jgi:hypothetical protein
LYITDSDVLKIFFLYLKETIYVVFMMKGKAAKTGRGSETKIRGILKELEDKIAELEKIRGKLEGLSSEEMSPEKTKAMLEEIKVPPLEVITEKPKKGR